MTKQEKFADRAGTARSVVLAALALQWPAACAVGAAGPEASDSVSQSGIVFASSGNKDFDAWRQGFTSTALERGHSAAAIRTALDGLRADRAVAKPRNRQAEFRRPIWSYVESAMRQGRIGSGRAHQQQYAPFLAAMSETYGVPGEILCAIWGIETNYGQNLGSHDAPQALANMAAFGHRRQFAEEQLLAVVDLLEKGWVNREQLHEASWAGAMGQTQFIPTTFEGYAVDWDRDGHRDLWRSVPDALGSAAHYLSRSGWHAGEPWVVEVVLPSGFEASLADGRKLSIEAWRGFGVKQKRGATPPGQLDAELFIPAGTGGPAFWLFDNFRVIKAYNNSDSYALSVGLLAHALAGGSPTVWPSDVVSLSAMEVRQLQRDLKSLGYDPGTVDGIVGRRTRRALSGYQEDQGLEADGFPTQDLLKKLATAAQLQATRSR